MESGDISMNCLSQKCLSHCRKKKQDRSREFSGWEEWYSSVFHGEFGCCERRRQTEWEASRKISSSPCERWEGRLRNIFTYESVWYDWVTPEWNMWLTIWGLLTRQKDRSEMKMRNSVWRGGNFAITYWRGAEIFKKKYILNATVTL